MRADAAETDFEQAFSEAQKMLSAADSFTQYTTTLGMPSAQQRFTVESRIVLQPPFEMTSTSEAIWRFRPHQHLCTHFIYEHVRSLVCKKKEIAVVTNHLVVA